MPDTSHIRALCERIGSLLSLRGELQSAVLALSDALEQDSMLPEETILGVHSRITDLSSVQTEILEHYKQLELGEFPENLSEAVPLLEYHEQEIIRIAHYSDIVRDFTSLTSDFLGAVEFLENHIAYVSSLNIPQMTEESCENALGKYIRFLDAVREESPEVRFGLLMEMKDLFEIKLLYALNSGAITLSVETEPTFETEPLKEESITWESLSITDPEAVCVHPDESLLVRTQTERKSEFRPVDFENDLKKTDTSLVRHVLNTLQSHYAVTPGLFSMN